MRPGKLYISLKDQEKESWNRCARHSILYWGWAVKINELPLSLISNDSPYRGCTMIHGINGKTGGW